MKDVEGFCVAQVKGRSGNLSIQHFVQEQDILSTPGQSAGTFVLDIHDPQWMIPNGFWWPPVASLHEKIYTFTK